MLPDKVHDRRLAFIRLGWTRFFFYFLTFVILNDFNRVAINILHCSHSFIHPSIHPFLTWDAHISSVSINVSSGIGVLKKIKPFVPTSNFDKCCWTVFRLLQRCVGWHQWSTHWQTSNITKSYCTSNHRRRLPNAY